MSAVVEFKNVRSEEYEEFFSQGRVRGSIMSMDGSYYYRVKVEFDTEEEAMIYQLKRIPVNRRF